jgi:hypothetical protein
MKEIFRSNWKRHFLKLNSIVSGLKEIEFKNVINSANEQRIWEYAKLEEFQLPYVFATLIEFPRANSWMRDGVHIRDHWYRFWFDASVRRYDDLWIHRPPDKPLLFCSAWYDLPKRAKKPSSKNLVDTDKKELNPSFLEWEASENRPPKWVQKDVEAWLNQKFQVD